MEAISNYENKDSNKKWQLKSFLMFYFSVVVRGLSKVFKRNRLLEVDFFDYYKNWQIENAYLIIEFKSRNAIFYKIGNFKSLKINRPIVLNLKNLNTGNLYLEIFGFFQKKTLLIVINKSLKIDTRTFKTKVINKHSFKIYHDQILLKEFVIKLRKPILVLENLEIQTHPITINFKPFKIEDYL